MQSDPVNRTSTTRSAPIRPQIFLSLHLQQAIQQGFSSPFQFLNNTDEETEMV